MKRFTVTFDYANKYMYLKPNKNYGNPMHFTRTGIFAKPGKNGFVVTTVIKGSPAAQAGIEAGDVITAINGRPASKLNPLTIAKRARNDPPGTKVKLTIGHGNRSHTVTITLHRLIPKTGRLAPEPSALGS
ncbi:MAG: PDZ domain-containing protein [Gammaproteobacteria bacterium]|nr:PDZ domain-containing protein [Gammaproteobacteria bacterium]